MASRENKAAAVRELPGQDDDEVLTMGGVSAVAVVRDDGSHLTDKLQRRVLEVNSNKTKTGHGFDQRAQRKGGGTSACLKGSVLKCCGGAC